MKNLTECHVKQKGTTIKIIIKMPRGCYSAAYFKSIEQAVKFIKKNNVTPNAASMRIGWVAARLA